MAFEFLDNVPGLKIIALENHTERKTPKRNACAVPLRFIKCTVVFLKRQIAFYPHRYQIYLPPHISPRSPVYSPAHLFLSLFLPALLSPHSNGRLAINSTLVWPETLLELNMNDWDCGSTCHRERRTRPARGKGDGKYPTYKPSGWGGLRGALVISEARHWGFII